MSDIPAIAKEAQAKDITVIMDNTWASAMYFDAFEKASTLWLKPSRIFADTLML